jgi:pimeloyl-ACP methyl ester carboxylesterase
VPRVTTRDGRTIHVHQAGDPGGLPVLVSQGTPGDDGPHADDAGSRGIRLIGYDRPGHGGSSPQPGRSVADGARDVEAIADALVLERLLLWHGEHVSSPRSRTGAGSRSGSRTSTRGSRRTTAT